MRKKCGKSKVKFVILGIIIIIFGILMWKENQRMVVCLDAGHGGKDVRLCVK